MKIEQQITNAVSNALKALYDITPDATAIQLQKTKKEFTGNLTLVVFPFLKASHKNPEATAQEIGEYLVKNNQEISSFNVIKGFLNLVISPVCWIQQLESIDKDVEYGTKSQAPDAQLVMVEYSSPNTNKPLHLGSCAQ